MDTVSRLTMLLPSLSTYVRDHWSCHHDCNAGRMWGPTWRNTPTRLLGWNAASMRPAQHRVTYRTLRVLQLQIGHETWLQTRTGALVTRTTGAHGTDKQLSNRSNRRPRDGSHGCSLSATASTWARYRHDGSILPGRHSAPTAALNSNRLVRKETSACWQVSRQH